MSTLPLFLYPPVRGELGTNVHNVKTIQEELANSYESPSSEIWMLESRNLICTSGPADGVIEGIDYETWEE